MTNPSEVVADLRIAAEDARRFSAALFDRGYVRREGVRPFSELLERAADTIDRLTSSGEAVAYRWMNAAGQLVYTSWKPTAAEALRRSVTPLYKHASPREGHVEVPVEPSGKYDDVLVPFIAMMERELHANSGKGDRPGWLAMSREELLLEIYYHLAKLQKAAIKDEADGIREFGADVANMSMMLVDRCAALPHNQGETKP